MENKYVFYEVNVDMCLMHLYVYRSIYTCNIYNSCVCQCTDKYVHIHIADLVIARLVYEAMPFSDHLAIEYTYIGSFHMSSNTFHS